MKAIYVCLVVLAIIAGLLITMVRPGNACFDFALNQNDLDVMKYHILGKRELSGIPFLLADLNHDFSITVSDYTLLRLKLDQ
jgi:hypothetical protein